MDVGVIGVGVMGKNHTRVYSELKKVTNLGVFDVNIKQAKEVGEKYDATVYNTLSELLDACEAVSIVVPTEHHAATTTEVLKHNVSALIEKPICTSSALAENIINSIPDGIIVGVGHIERFNPIVNEIKKIVTNPLYIEFKRHNPASARSAGSSIVFDLMIHDIDILLHTFKLMPEESCAVGNRDVMSVMTQCENIPVVLSASRKASKKIRSLYVEDEMFTIEGNFMTQEVTIYRKPERYHTESGRYNQENIIEKVLVNTVEPLKIELDMFIDCVNEGRAFPVTPEQAAMNVAFCESIIL